jgi:hypothetical protein
VKLYVTQSHVQDTTAALSSAYKAVFLVIAIAVAVARLVWPDTIAAGQESTMVVNEYIFLLPWKEY